MHVNEGLFTHTNLIQWTVMHPVRVRGNSNTFFFPLSFIKMILYSKTKHVFDVNIVVGREAELQCKLWEWLFSFSGCEVAFVSCSFVCLTKCHRLVQKTNVIILSPLALNYFLTLNYVLSFYLLYFAPS